MRVTDFQLVDHGIEYEQYFQGCGVSFTPFSDCQTGIGDNPAEALDDCLDQVACSGVDVEGLEMRIRAEGWNCKNSPRVKASQDECHYYLSLRYNTEE